MKEKDFLSEKPKNGEADEPVNCDNAIVQAIREFGLLHVEGRMKSRVESLVNPKCIIAGEKYEARGNKSPYPGG